MRGYVGYSCKNNNIDSNSININKKNNDINSNNNNNDIKGNPLRTISIFDEL